MNLQKKNKNHPLAAPIRILLPAVHLVVDGERHALFEHAPRVRRPPKRTHRLVRMKPSERLTKPRVSRT